MARAYIGLGSNLGQPQHNLEAAINWISQLGHIAAQSSIYLTKPWGMLDQPDFCNAVIQLETGLSARELLQGLQAIEKLMGRTPTVKWGPRLIDLDILMFDDLQINEPDLTIPHPHYSERAFVLVPLCEIAPQFQEALERLPILARREVSKSLVGLYSPGRPVYHL